jgi:hypothetical protein
MLLLLLCCAGTPFLEREREREREREGEGEGEEGNRDGLQFAYDLHHHPVNIY